MVLSDLESKKMGISRTKRDLPPSDYLFKIQSYSLSMDKKVEKYESKVFHAGGYAWKLVLYPSGNSKRNGKGHVSLYLAIADRDKLSRGWEVNVNFKLFVYDHNCSNYLTIQDADGVVRRFNEMKTEWGFDQLISLEELFDSYNGYLVEDSCVFGAEVLVIRHSAQSESLSMAVDKPPTYGSFNWKFDNFLLVPKKADYFSKTFTIGERDWTFSCSRGIFYLSLFLRLTDCERFPLNTTVKVSVKFKLFDHLRNQYYEKTEENFSFGASREIMGFSEFIQTSIVENENNGYIKDGAIIMEVEIFKMDIILEPPPAHESFTWNIENLSKSDTTNNGWFRRKQTGPQRSWEFSIYGKDIEAVSKTKRFNADRLVDKHLPLYIRLSGTTGNRTLNATFKCKILNQLHTQPYEKTETFSIRMTSVEEYACLNLISLSELNRAENGYIKDDAMIIHVEISNIYVV